MGSTDFVNSYDYINVEWEEYLKKCEEKIAKINNNCPSGFDLVDKVFDGGFKKGCVYFVISSQEQYSEMFVKTLAQNFERQSIDNCLINIDENMEYKQLFDACKSRKNIKVMFVKTPKDYSQLVEKDFFFLNRIASKKDVVIIVIPNCKSQVFVSTSFCLYASFVLNNLDDKIVLKLYNHKNQRTYEYFVEENNKKICILKKREVEFKELLNQSSADPLYSKALKLVVQNNTASISFLQRMLIVGYPRSAFLIAKMENDGYISCPDKNGKRQVLIDANEYIAKFGNIDE